jgi:3-oxoacid CoA-transferase
MLLPNASKQLLVTLPQIPRTKTLAARLGHRNNEALSRGIHASTARRREIRQPAASETHPASDKSSRKLKLFKSADEAVADLSSGSVILSAGFGLCGTAGLY